MMAPEHIRVDVEIRESDDGPRLHGVVVQEGRASRGGRAEIFAPESITWPPSGIEIRTVHRQPSSTRAMPVRMPDGRIAIAVKATPAIQAAVASGKSGLSVEFHTLRETRTAAGIREIELALVTAAALTDNPEYHQATAEVRDRKVRRWWL